MTIPAANQIGISLDEALEAALHAYVMRRCERAFVHELRDGLQGIAVSIDAFSRMFEKGPAAMEKLTPMAKRTLQAHDQAIERTVRHMVMSDGDVENVKAEALLRQIFVLLRNEAAKRDASLLVEPTGEVDFNAHTNKSLLAMLSIVIRLIDAMSGGELRIAARREVDKIVIEFSTQMPVDAHDWSFPAAVSITGNNLPDNWMMYAIRRLVEADGGSIESTEDISGEQPSRVVRIRYPR